MKQNISLWQFAGFSLTALGGTLLHFMYEWTDRSIFIAPFSGVNESTWEHMKLLYFPMFVFALVQRRFFMVADDFWCIKLKGTLTGLLLIPTLFYLYNGAITQSPDWLNITIFFVSAAIAFFVEARAFKKSSRRCAAPRFAFTLLCVIGILFAVFTFITPHINIFRDPITGAYGIINGR